MGWILRLRLAMHEKVSTKLAIGSVPALSNKEVTFSVRNVEETEFSL